MAREAGADGLIALGGGTVVQAARIAAILLAEEGPPEALATQYPEDGPAISPRLMAPKLPILNALTIGTTAQDRGGSPAKGCCEEGSEEGCTAAPRSLSLTAPSSVASSPSEAEPLDVPCSSTDTNE